MELGAFALLALAEIVASLVAGIGGAAFEAATQTPPADCRPMDPVTYEILGECHYGEPRPYDPFVPLGGGAARPDGRDCRTVSVSELRACLGARQ